MPFAAPAALIAKPPRPALCPQKDHAGYVTHAAKPVHRVSFWSYLRRLCKEASILQVCPHSLRGLHTTLAIEAGATSESVARSLGHGSFSMTAKHYASADTVLSSRQQRVSQPLGTDTPTQIAALLSLPTAAEIEELSRQLNTA